MKTLKPLSPTAPLRMMALTVLLAIGATAAQTAGAQPHEMRSGGEHRHGSEHRHGHGHGNGEGHDQGYGRGMGMGGPRMTSRLLDTVNASAEQRAQIKQITDAARADMKAQHDGSRQLRDEAAALFAQPTVDARAAEALRQQMLARHDQASKRQLQMMLDISRVLTPEQRKTLADKMAQRRSAKERHHGERSGSEAKPSR